MTPGEKILNILKGEQPHSAVDAAQLQFIDPQQCGRGILLEYCHYTCY